MSKRRAVFVSESRASQNFKSYIQAEFFENLSKISTKEGIQQLPSEAAYTFEKSGRRINGKNKTHLTSPE